VAGDALYVHGGSGADKKPMADLWVLRLRSDS
jgi:hypothetical protein